MPRASQLTDIEKGQIIAYRKSGKGYGYIAKQLGRTKAGIQSFVRKLSPTFQIPPKIKRPGRKKKLTAADERLIGRLASNSTRSSSQIKQDCALEVHSSTIRRSISRNPNLCGSKLKAAPKITDRHKAKRLEFAFQNMDRDWMKVRLSFFVLFQSMSLFFHYRWSLVMKKSST